MVPWTQALCHYDSWSDSGGGINIVDMLDKEMIHIRAGQRRTVRFHHTIQNGMQFKTYQLFIFCIFHLIILGYSWSWIIETVNRETTDKEGVIISNYDSNLQYTAYMQYLSSLLEKKCQREFLLC